MRNRLLLLLCACTAALSAQTGAVCTITAVPPQVRSEGVTERIGEIVFRCTAAPGAEVTGNLSVLLNTAVTNRLLPNGTLDAVLTVDGNQANAPATLGAPNQVNFSGLRLSFPASGALELRLANIRADASFGGAPGMQPGPGANPVINAQLTFNPGGLVTFSQSLLQVAVPQRGFFATPLGTVIPSQQGSPLPAALTFSELIRTGTSVATTRVSEGFPSSFEPRTRVLLRFSGFPADARLFVPAAVAGSSALAPTAAGDFGGTPSGGQYTPGSGTLLLQRIVNTDDQGGGGFLAAALPASGTFEAMTEVTLSSGMGIAVYEIADASSQLRESAQVPVFIGLPGSASPRNLSLQVEASLAPVARVFTADLNSPVPRFAPLPAPSDCDLVGDCGRFLPRLGAAPVNTSFRLTRGVGAEERVLPITNEGGGSLAFNVRVEYKSGSDWIFLDTVSSPVARPVRMVVRAVPTLTPGTYEATVIIDAGPAGVARYPVTLEVLPAPPPVRPAPQVRSVVSGATFREGPVAPGSYVTLFGENIGNNPTVTFSGTAATVVFSNAGQINVRVPERLFGETAQVVVSSEGQTSAPVTVRLAPISPGIFEPGILNQDSTVHGPVNPANTGSVVQIFATGLLPPDGTGQVEARLHDRTLTDLLFAGPAPGLPGLQQVNLRIPVDLPTMTTEVLLCATASGQRVCSPPVKIHLRRAQ